MMRSSRIGDGLGGGPLLPSNVAHGPSAGPSHAGSPRCRRPVCHCLKTRDIQAARAVTVNPPSGILKSGSVDVATAVLRALNVQTRLATRPVFFWRPGQRELGFGPGVSDCA
jgi:hypothetical protein